MGICAAEEDPKPEVPTEGGSSTEAEPKPELSAEQQKKIDAAWAMFDVDHSGFLELTECKKVVMRINESALQSVKEELATKQKNAALKKDKNAYADQAILTAMISRLEDENKKFEAERDGSTFMGRTDADSDGKVSKEEFTDYVVARIPFGSNLANAFYIQNSN